VPASDEEVAVRRKKLSFVQSAQSKENDRFAENWMEGPQKYTARFATRPAPVDCKPIDAANHLDFVCFNHCIEGEG
jgi:hypothetical protein